MTQATTPQQLNYLHNVETRFYCAQMFLSSDLQCKDAISELK